MLANQQSSQTSAEVLALTHANVIDVVSTQPLRDAIVIVRAGRIESVSTGAAAPANATIIALQGRWMLSGLIDAHTHIADLAALSASTFSPASWIKSISTR
ncbi:MAG: hypothetical protein JNK38_10530 [Acidobacteria bacterium]|nr:hypothetical protein [Acidobacteriota bacterium]